MATPSASRRWGHWRRETIGAIIAGIFLGTLSLWTRSIGLGVLIHVTVAVAVAMDLAALRCLSNAVSGRIFSGEKRGAFGVLNTEERSLDAFNQVWSKSAR